MAVRNAGAYFEARESKPMPNLKRWFKSFNFCRIPARLSVSPIEVFAETLSKTTEDCSPGMQRWTEAITAIDKRKDRLELKATCHTECIQEIQAVTLERWTASTDIKYHISTLTIASLDNTRAPGLGKPPEKRTLIE